LSFLFLGLSAFEQFSALVLGFPFVVYRLWAAQLPLQSQALELKNMNEPMLFSIKIQSSL
jgi:hypothetical protein